MNDEVFAAEYAGDCWTAPTCQSGWASECGEGSTYQLATATKSRAVYDLDRYPKSLGHVEELFRQDTNSDKSGSLDLSKRPPRFAVLSSTASYLVVDSQPTSPAVQSFFDTAFDRPVAIFGDWVTVRGVAQDCSQGATYKVSFAWRVADDTKNYLVLVDNPEDTRVATKIKAGWVGLSDVSLASEVDTLLHLIEDFNDCADENRNPCAGIANSRCVNNVTRFSGRVGYLVVSVVGWI